MSLQVIVGRRLSVLRTVLMSAALVSLVACAPRDTRDDATAEPAADETPAASAPSAASEAPAAPARVFFLRPREGDLVRPSLRARFGVEHFTIEPVGDGEVHAGAGHYHVGVDTDCLPAGEIIPQAAPWIHLGDGSSEIEMQLAPGEHRLCLQVGDGEHRTLAGAGMSELITITVKEEEPPSDRGKA